jgi:uncharacterized protein
MSSCDLKPPVYVVGASGRSAAESVRQAGFRAIVVDLYADRDSGEACDILQIESYPDSVAAQLKSLEHGVVLLAGGMENHVELIDQVGKYHRILGPNVEQIKRIRDHEFLVSSINKSDHDGVLRFPETVPTVHDVDPKDNWLCKSFFGCGGFHIERFHDDYFANLKEGNYYFQREVTGQSVGTVFLCERSNVQLLGVTAAIDSLMHQSITGPQPILPPMAYRGSYGLIALPNIVKEAMCNWAFSFAQSLDYTGIMQADWITCNSVAWLLEVNPRWTASMEIIEWAQGCNLFSIQASLDNELKLMLSTAPAMVSRIAPMNILYKAIQYANSPFIVSEEQSNEMLASKFNRFERNAPSSSDRFGWCDIPRAGTPIETGQPIASYFKY